MQPKDRIIVALDVPDTSSAMLIIEQTHQHVGCYKVGLELIAAQQAGRVINWIKEVGAKVFYDIKLNDIPNTVSKAILSAKSLGVDIINVHATIGMKAMVEAVKAAGDDILVAAVSVLTSLDDDDLADLGFDVSEARGDAAGQFVCHFARLINKAGIKGLICSPKDLEHLRREELLGKFLKITPGVRPVWAAADDQKRITTPAEAIIVGSDYLVVGRPITNPPNGMSRAEAAQRILGEVTLACQTARS